MYSNTIWGEKCGIRPLRPTDAPALRRYSVDPELGDLLYEDNGGFIPTTFQLVVSIAMQRLQGRPDWAIVDRHGRMIGRVLMWRISEQNRSAMLTIYVGEKSYWGTGCGTEALRLVLRQAFGAFGLHRVELHVFEFNRRAIRSYEKVGFVREGGRRQALKRGTQYQDILVMGILRDEFIARETERNSTSV